MKMNQAPKSTGLQENVASLLCYVLGWITGIIFLILEPNNKTIKFHAIQSIIVFGSITVAHIILDWIPFVGWFVFMPILWVIWVISWILLMVKAYQGGTWHYPIAGNIAERYVK
jgi:uncharacterized membrane protein